MGEMCIFYKVPVVKADDYKATQTQCIAPWISCESNESWSFIVIS